MGHRALVGGLLGLAWLEERGPRPPVDHGRLVFVLHTAFGMGGTIRATITQANQAVKDGKHVTLLSVTRKASQVAPFFHIDGRVELRVLDDPRDPRHGGGPRHLLSKVPGVLFHPEETRSSRMSLWSDLVLARELRRQHHSVVVGTRAGLNVAVALLCRPDVVRIGQEHVPFSSYPPSLLRELASTYPRLHGLMVLTQGDRAVATRLLEGAATGIHVVPNALPEVPRAVSDCSSNIIVTAGRLSRGKRQDVLLRAFALVASRHPHWKLRIYGHGPRRERLGRLADRLGVSDRVLFMGASDRLGLEFAESSIFVLSSELEAFGIALIEAMRSGLAVVSTDCDHGPRDIITPDLDGVLVPPNEPRDLARALDRLMGAPALRVRLGNAARASSARFEPAVLAEAWEASYHAADAVRIAGPHHSRKSRHSR